MTIHSRLEDEVVFPVVRQLDAAMAAEGEASNQKIDELVATIRERGYVDDDGVRNDLDTLEREVEHHVHWEENTLLPRIGGLASDDADRLGHAVYERHQELLKEFPRALELSAETEGFRAGHWV